jgi:predicted Na+-dependent transporter
MAWVLVLLNVIAVSFGWLIGRRVGLEGEVRRLVMIGCAAVTVSILAAMFADAVLGLVDWLFRRFRRNG